MKNFNNKVVAITGAASGIGKELALQFAKQGACLALNDWNKDNLSTVVKEFELAGVQVIGFPFDVSDRTFWQSFADKIINHFGHLDIFINNAGIVNLNSRVEEMSPDLFSRILNINMWGTVHGTQTMLPLLKNRTESSLIYINSSFGLVAFPGLSAYTMSKFAIRGLTETLQIEHRDQKNFHIMSVYPGGVNTNLIRNIKNADPDQLNNVIRIFDKHALSTAPQVAKRVIKGIQKQKTRIIIGKDSRYMDIIGRLFPSFYRFLMQLPSPSRKKSAASKSVLSKQEVKAKAIKV